MSQPSRRNPSDTQISALHQEAARAADMKAVAICTRALAGSARARREVAKMMADARAMED